MTKPARQTFRRLRALALLVAGLSLGAGALVPVTAPAAGPPPPTLWQRCDGSGGAGQCLIAGIATSPSGGNVYVLDRINNRIDEFNAWGLFLKAWGWGVADGTPELQSCGPQATPPDLICEEGIEGNGPGQFGSGLRGIAVDTDGNIFTYATKGCIGGTGCEVAPHENRVQKFDSGGHFLLTFGRQVNLSKVKIREDEEANAEPVTVTQKEENICTAASGDSCGPGIQGSGAGEFGPGPVSPIYTDGGAIAVGPDDTIYIGGTERIQKFDAEGNYLAGTLIPDEVVSALAVDHLGNAYVAYDQRKNVVKLAPGGEPLCTASVAEPKSLAIDAEGNFYVSDGVQAFHPTSDESDESDVSLRKFGANCVEFAIFAFPVFGLGTGDGGGAAIAVSSACGIDGVDIYFGNNSTSSRFLRAYGPHPDAAVCPPPAVAPTIASQYTVAADTNSAVVRAQINPHFWADTSYYLQYGTEDCKAHPGACGQTALSPGAELGAENDSAVDTADVFLDSLEPNTTYYYRFIAKSGGGAPTVGSAEEEGASFTTYPPPPAAKLDCPNQSLRAGASTHLPDCRAYEMVSPIDKAGGDIVSLTENFGGPASLEQSAVSGERMTYSSYRAFADPKSAPYTSQYVASRGSAGWSSEAISPPQEGPRLGENESLLSSYKAFDDELCSGWVLPPAEPPLSEDAIPGYTNLYRRDNCGTGVGSYEALSRVQPTVESNPGVVTPLPRLEFLPSIQGFSADGSHVVFRSAGRLAEGAATCAKQDSNNQCPRQLYDYHGGELALVCVLPGESPSSTSCSAGTGLGAEFDSGHNNVTHAVSDDGSRIFWTNARSGPGKLYVRIGGEETLLISSPAAQFWTAAADGSRVIFSVPYSPSGGGAGDLYEFGLEGEGKHLIASQVLGLLGAGDDDRRVYFASTEALSGDEENSEGSKAQAGKPNLYLFESGEAGGITFIATLNGDDVENVRSAIQTDPAYRTSRVTPDGLHAAFTSSAPLTGADNIDANSGKADTEVFLYEAGTGELRCASCNPSGIRPDGRQIEVNGSPIGPWQAGAIPGWTDQTHPSRVLSADGSRLFFNSTEPLVLADTNGTKDVYEWEAGESQADCTEAGAEMFLAAEGGCLSLISSGESPADSEFVDAGGNGRDVFFKTISSLVPQDLDQLDVYDAREGGGFPVTPGQPAACEGEACQSPPVPPSNPTPASLTFRGAENVVEKPTRKKRGKKSRARKHRKKSHAKQRQANHHLGGQK